MTKGSFGAITKLKLLTFSLVHSSEVTIVSAYDLQMLSPKLTRMDGNKVISHHRND